MTVTILPGPTLQAVIQQDPPNSVTVVESPRPVVNVTQPNPAQVTVNAGTRLGTVILHGTGSPPDPSGIPDGTIYLKHS